MTDEVKKLGEPLTLEQLRGMDGEPVLLVFDFELEPMISLVEYVQDDDCIILTNNLGGRSEFYSDEELRECGIKVYAYPPVKLDGWTTHWVERERHAGGFHEETGRIVPAPGILSGEKATVLVDGRGETWKPPQTSLRSRPKTCGRK